jgi:hypothetical protein
VLTGFQDRLGLNDFGLYTKCLVPEDTLARGIGANKKAEPATNVLVINKITATIVQKQEYAGTLPKILISSGSKTDEKQFSTYQSSTSSSNAKTVGVTMSVLMDTNNNGQGDTPILFEGRPQQFKFNYYIKEQPKENYAPTVDIVEPITEYVNDFEELWVGANIQDEKNQITDITLKINNGKKKTSCTSSYQVVNGQIQSISVPNSVGGGASGNGCNIYEIEDLAFSKVTSPSFIRFKLKLENAPHDLFDIGSPDYYTVNLEVSDGEKTGKSYKGFRLYSEPSVHSYAVGGPGTTLSSLSSQGSTSYATPPGGNIVCLGSGSCAQWVEPKTPTEVILDPSLPQEQKLQSVIPGQYGAPNLPASNAYQQQYDNYGNQWSYNQNTDYSTTGWNSGYGSSSYNSYNSGSYSGGYGSNGYNGYGTSNPYSGFNSAYNSAYPSYSGTSWS